jgi:single-strand DNA-binding protein
VEAGNTTRSRDTSGTSPALASAAGDEEESAVNVVTLIGNLATEVELRDLPDGRKVANFVLAIDRASGEGTADFVRVCTWERQAELCAEHLGKGSRVAVDGRLRSRSWEEDGKRRNAIEVVARRVEFLGGRRDEGGRVLPFEPVTAA